MMLVQSIVSKMCIIHTPLMHSMRVNAQTCWKLFKKIKNNRLWMDSRTMNASHGISIWKFKSKSNFCCIITLCDKTVATSNTFSSNYIYSSLEVRFWIRCICYKTHFMVLLKLKKATINGRTIWPDYDIFAKLPIIFSSTVNKLGKTC